MDSFFAFLDALSAATKTSTMKLTTLIDNVIIARNIDKLPKDRIKVDVKKNNSTDFAHKSALLVNHVDKTQLYTFFVRRTPLSAEQATYTIYRMYVTSGKISNLDNTFDPHNFYIMYNSRVVLFSAVGMFDHALIDEMNKVIESDTVVKTHLEVLNKQFEGPKNPHKLTLNASLSVSQQSAIEPTEGMFETLKTNLRECFLDNSKHIKSNFNYDDDTAAVVSKFPARTFPTIDILNALKGTLEEIGEKFAEEMTEDKPLAIADVCAGVGATIKIVKDIFPANIDIAVNMTVCEHTPELREVLAKVCTPEENKVKLTLSGSMLETSPKGGHHVVICFPPALEKSESRDILKSGGKKESYKNMQSLYCRSAMDWVGAGGYLITALPNNAKRSSEYSLIRGLLKENFNVTKVVEYGADPKPVIFIVAKREVAQSPYFTVSGNLSETPVVADQVTLGKLFTVGMGNFKTSSNASRLSDTTGVKVIYADEVGVGKFITPKRDASSKKKPFVVPQYDSGLSGPFILVNKSAVKDKVRAVLYTDADKVFIENMLLVITKKSDATLEDCMAKLTSPASLEYFKRFNTLTVDILQDLPY